MFLLLGLVLCEFVVGGAYSEVETSFVVMGSEGVVVDDLDFWGAYGDYLVAGVIGLVVVAVYFSSVKGRGKRSKRRGK